MGVRQCEINLIVKRETAQIYSYRSQIVSKWKTMWKYADNQDVGSEAATHLKSA